MEAVWLSLSDAERLYYCPGTYQPHTRDARRRARTPARGLRENPHMVTRERVQTVIDRIRPLLQSDGGDIELVDVMDNRAKVRLTGNCVGCPSAQMTLYFGVETVLKDEIPELEELLVV